jgi:uridine kinase
MISSRLAAWILTRLVFIAVFQSVIQLEKFSIFLTSSNGSFVDPWSAWINNQGRSDAFPYGVVMYVAFLPAVFLYKVIQTTDLELNFTYLMGLTLLLFDYILLKLLDVFNSKNPNAWSWFAIFSPLPIYISFIHGQIDLIPSLLMLISALFIFRSNWIAAGLFFGLAFSAKFSFALAIPFLVFYIVSSKARWSSGLAFIRGTLPGLFLAIIPVVFSDGYRLMVLSTPEVLKTLDAQLDIGISTIFLVPIVFLMLFFSFWNLIQVSPQVLISYIGTAYFAIALMQTSSVGWFYWSLPLILLALRESKFRTLLLLFLLQLTICLYFALRENHVILNPIGKVVFWSAANIQLMALLFTFNCILGTFLLLKVLKETLKFGDIYALSKKPLSVSIAGDSGVGKDTLSSDLAQLFGRQEVTLLLGDDYHLHERGESSWLTTTHLALEANDIETMGRDFKKLLNRESVVVKHYDHTIGRFTMPRKINSSQLVIVNGLHANMIPGSELTDLRIYMSMEDALRIELKLARDKNERKQFDQDKILQSISARIPDFEKFVKPQLAISDLQFFLKRIPGTHNQVGIELISKNSAFILEFKEAYNAVSLIPATYSRSDGMIKLVMDPSYFTANDASLIFNVLVESPEQLFPIRPSFVDGSRGLLSLISVVALAKKRMNNV